MRAILICPDTKLRSDFEGIAAHHSFLRLNKSLDNYPSPDALRRLMRMWGPEVIFISVEDTDAAGHLAEQLEAEFASVQRIGLSTIEDPSILRLALQFRMAELLVPPFEDDRFVQMLNRLNDHLVRHPSSAGKPGQVYAFMPAKGGVGASTIAANVTWALAQSPGSNVLLADFDSSSGVAGFIFNADHEYSMNDAAKHTKHLDDETWQRLVKRVNGIDLLLSGGPSLEEGNQSQQIMPVLDFARRNYSIVAADLADTFDERCMAVMREANQIFLVTTPELASLRMARLKALVLRKLEWEDKTRLLLNRATRRMELSEDEIEATVGLPVYATFPCDYADVTRATRKGEASPKLAPSIRQFLEKLGDRKAPVKKPSRFIERFAVVPARYGFR